MSDKLLIIPKPDLIKKYFFTAILSLFLHRKLNYDPNVSTALFHTYEFLVYLFTFFGAIIAESWLGMFKTIACTTLVYSFGSAIVAFSGIETIDLPLR